MSEFSEIDNGFMIHAFNLALRGCGVVSPNPMVGSVLVKNAKVVSEGYHAAFGQLHAEAEAIKCAGENARNSTLYVNLEPCNHHGHNPPCTEAIIKAGIKEVFCSNTDPNPNVTGNGLQCLEESGINVRTGLLRDDGYKLNEIYFKNITMNMPFVTLKAAMSLDGYIYSPDSSNRYLSSEPFLEYVHCLRAGYDAVLVGAGTANFDNPSLNVRYNNGRDPVRIIITDGQPLPSELKVFNLDSNARTIVAVSSESSKSGLGKKAEVWTINSQSTRFPIMSLLEKAATEGITSILVEGGSDVFNSFINEKAFDKIIISHTPYLYGKGVPFISNKGRRSSFNYMKFKSHRWERIGEDSVFIGYPDFTE